ncbi:MAG: hypothetical protein E6I08_14600 [Chloroflexi bacterium]|nr:MAG: hypothetical protein E6I08_14600 [Chloroflexota bacterium]
MKSNTRRLRLALIGSLVAMVASVAPATSTAAAGGPSAVDYAQCSNSQPPSSDAFCSGGWINGILNANNSHYREDQVTAQRLELLIPAGSAVGSHSVQISYLARKAGHHAYDSLATWNSTATAADRCQGLSAGDCVPVRSGSVLPGQAWSQLAIPYDCTPVAAGTLPGANQGGCLSTSGEVTARHQLPGQYLLMYGGYLDAMSLPAHDAAATAGTDDYATVTVSFHLDGANGVTTADQRVQLLFGGHLAPQLGPRGWGAGLGAGSINGGPYHIKWLAVDGASIGNRDNQIMAGAVIVPSSTATQAQSSPDGAIWSSLADGGSILVGRQVRDTADVGDASATGTVAYQLYTGTGCVNGAPDGSPVAAFGSSGTSLITISSGAIPASAAFTPGVGTYQFIATYSGDAVHTGSTSSCGSERFTVNKLSPSLGTQIVNDSNSGTALANGASVAIGTTVHDTATFAGATAGAGGTVTYNLYSGSACSNGTPGGSLVTGFGSNGSAAVTVSGSTIPASPAFSLTSAGSYQFIARYSGDANNNAVNSPCGSETFTVQPNATSTTTQVQVLNSNGTLYTNLPNGQAVAFASTVRDTATLSGATSTAGGTVTYKLYSGSACAGNSPTGSLVASWANGGSSTVVVSNGIAPVSPGFDGTAAGSYQFIVTYSGDNDNAASTSACGSETFVVNPATAQLTTLTQAVSAGPTYTPIANGASVAIGTVIRDTAALANNSVNAGGTVTYSLYTGAGCTDGSPLGSLLAQFGTNGSAAVAVANGVVLASPSVTLTTAGTYQFIAQYSGDANNQPATSACGSEVVVVAPNNTATTTQAQVISGQASSNLGNGAHVAIGTTVRDTVSLGGATPGAAGTVTYRLFTGSGCSNGWPTGSPVTGFGSGGASAVAVNSATAPPSSNYTVLAAGDFQFIAAYSGDVNNGPSVSACGSETFTVDRNSAAVATQTQTVDGQTTAPLTPGGSVKVGTTVRDTATLSGATADAAGTVVFQLFSGKACSNGSPTGALVTGFGTGGSSTMTVSGGSVPASAAFTATPAGDYQFIATYSGDAGNTAAVSPCGSETFTVDPAVTALSTQAQSLNGQAAANLNQGGHVSIGATVDDTSTLTGNTPGAGGSVIYRLYHGSACSAAGAPTGSLVSSFGTGGASTVAVSSGSVPASASLVVSDPGDYQFIATYSGDNNNAASTSACGSETFTVNANTTTTTTVQALSGDTVADTPNGAALDSGSTVRDTALLSGTTGTAGGSVTYRLYTGTACTGGAPTGTLVSTFGNAGAAVVSVTEGAVPASPALNPAPGTYQFVVSYSGDADNNPSASACGSETFSVKFPAVIATKPNVSSGAVGVAIHDVATVSGGSTPGGTVTFALYGPGDATCQTNLVAGDARFTVALSSGSATSPDVTTTDVGIYQWVARYSGDAGHMAGAGACGDATEQVVTAAVLSEISLPPTGSIPHALLLGGLAPIAIGLLLLILGRRRRQDEEA